MTAPEATDALIASLTAWAGLVSSGYEVPAAGQVMLEAKATLSLQQARVRELEGALEGMLSEWDKFTRYGSPMAKAANEAVNFARQALPATKDGEP